MSEDCASIRKALERERSRRNLAEKLLEEKSRELYVSYQELEAAHQELTQNKEFLVQSEKMASLGVMAAGVAHEINNPVGFMLSNLDTLREYERVFVQTFACLLDVVRGIDDASPLAQRRDAALAYVSGNDLEYLVEDTGDLLQETRNGLLRVKDIVAGLKAFSRIDTGALGELDVNACITQTLQLAAAQMRKVCDVTTDLAADLPVIQGNPARVSQVLINLLVNAADAVSESMPGHPPTDPTITVRSRQVGDQLQIQVEDNGCGMDEELQKRIFQPFYTTKDVGHGTGLGLSISHGIIEEHAGSLKVESAPGTGTTFTISLPLQRIAPGAMAHPG